MLAFSATNHGLKCVQIEVIKVLGQYPKNGIQSIGTFRPKIGKIRRFFRSNEEILKSNKNPKQEFYTKHSSNFVEVAEYDF